MAVELQPLPVAPLLRGCHGQDIRLDPDRPALLKAHDLSIPGEVLQQGYPADCQNSSRLYPAGNASPFGGTMVAPLP